MCFPLAKAKETFGEHLVIESLRLEETTVVIKSNPHHTPSPTSPQKYQGFLQC